MTVSSKHTDKLQALAAELDISEYDIFLYAYVEYFRTSPKDKYLEHQFAQWMHHNDMPCYVVWYLDNSAGVLEA